MYVLKGRTNSAMIGFKPLLPTGKNKNIGGYLCNFCMCFFLLSLQLCNIVCLFLIRGLLKSFYLLLFVSILGGKLPSYPPPLDETLSTNQYMKYYYSSCKTIHTPITCRTLVCVIVVLNLNHFLVCLYNICINN